jgi:hypothetical protein
MVSSMGIQMDLQMVWLRVFQMDFPMGFEKDYLLMLQMVRKMAIKKELSLEIKSVEYLGYLWGIH